MHFCSFAFMVKDVPRNSLPASVDTLQFLEAIVEASPEGMLAVDHGGTVLVWNESFLKIFSLPEDYCSYPAPERFRILTSEIKADPKVMDFLRSVYQDRTESRNLELESLDGRAILLSTTPLRIPGNPLGTLWTCRDLTSQRRAEKSRDDFLAKYQILFDNVHEGLSLYRESPDGHRYLVDCNQRYTELSGRTKEELQACPDTRLWQKNLVNDNEHFSNLQRYFHSEPWKGFFHWIRPDGKVNFLAYSAAPLEISGEKYTFGIDWDITDLILARDQSEHALQAKTHFLARASHEIRTPLTTLLGYADLLQELDLPPAAQEPVKNIALSGKLLLSLVNDLLDLSRVENGQMEIAPRWTDLHALLTDVGSLFALQFQQKGILWCTEFAPKGPMIWMDPIRIRQILANLLGHVLKFSGKGRVLLTMGPRCGDSGVVFTISGDALVVNGDTEDFGLMIAKGLISLMDGSLSMSKDPQGGATLSLDFPRAVWQVPKEERGMNPEQLTKVILIADDDISNRVLIKGFLRNTEYEVIEAVNGKEAVDLCAQQNPLMILMDLKMPVLNGRDAAAQIRETESGRSLRIVAMTAADYQDAFGQSDQTLWDDFLNKPFSRQRLIDLLRKHLP